MNLYEDEPIFMLRAADFHAPRAVTHWARTVIQNPKSTEYQFRQATQALIIADNMHEWQQNNPEKVKLPDKI